MRPSAAEGTPSGSWRPPRPTAASLGLDADSAPSRAALSAWRRSGSGSRCARPTSTRLGEVAPAAGFGAVDWHPLRPRPQLVPAGRHDARLLLPRRGAARPALRPLARPTGQRTRRRARRRRPRHACCATYGEEPFARRIARAIVRERGGDARSRPPTSSQRSSSGPCPSAPAGHVAHASIPRRARSRPCASPSTEELEVAAPRARCGRGAAAPGRAPRGPQLPLPRGSPRQALRGRRAARLRVPTGAAGLRVRPRAAPASGGSRRPGAPAPRRSPPTPAPAALACGPPNDSPREEPRRAG